MYDSRYISESIGTSLISTFRHNLRSCSGVRVGGGGRVDSPPKSTLEESTLSRFSSEAFSSIILGGEKTWEGQEEILGSTYYLTPTHDSSAGENAWIPDAKRASEYEVVCLFLLFKTLNLDAWVS